MLFSASQEMHVQAPSLPQAVDTHLIMNAMNQIAARDISLSGIENPLLFALSDYLRESLSKLDIAAVNIRTDVRHAEAHLMLHACVAHSTMEMDVSGCPADVFKIPRGTLAVLAVGCTKALRLPAHGRWQLLLSFDPVNRDDEWISFSTSFSLPGKALAADLPYATSLLQGLPIVLDGSVVFEASRSIESLRDTIFFFFGPSFFINGNDDAFKKSSRGSGNARM